LPDRFETALATALGKQTRPDMYVGSVKGQGEAPVADASVAGAPA
jgi:hypothetical protein